MIVIHHYYNHDPVLSIKITKPAHPSRPRRATNQPASQPTPEEEVAVVVVVVVVSHSRPPSEKEEQSGIQLIACFVIMIIIIAAARPNQNGQNHHEGALPTLSPVMGHGSRSVAHLLHLKGAPTTSVVSL